MRETHRWLVLRDYKSAVPIYVNIMPNMEHVDMNPEIVWYIYLLHLEHCFRITLDLPSGNLTYLLKMAIYSDSSHERWRFSRAIFVYQKVRQIWMGVPNCKDSCILKGPRMESTSWPMQVTGQFLGKTCSKIMDFLYILPFTNEYDTHGVFLINEFQRTRFPSGFLGPQSWRTVK